ncbi:MAG: hypothetical protein Q9227_001692 [Pyrenula ochraceoflavens]
MAADESFLHDYSSKKTQRAIFAAQRVIHLVWGPAAQTFLQIPPRQMSVRTWKALRDLALSCRDPRTANSLLNTELSHISQAERQCLYPALIKQAISAFKVSRDTSNPRRSSNLLQGETSDNRESDIPQEKSSPVHKERKPSNQRAEDRQGGHTPELYVCAGSSPGEGTPMADRQDEGTFSDERYDVHEVSARMVDIQDVGTPMVDLEDIPETGRPVVDLEDTQETGRPVVDLEDIQETGRPAVDLEDIQEVGTPMVDLEDIQETSRPVVNLEDIQEGGTSMMNFRDIQEVGMPVMDPEDAPELVSPVTEDNDIQKEGTHVVDQELLEVIRSPAPVHAASKAKLLWISSL